MDSSDRRIFEQNVAHVCGRGEARGMVYKRRQTEVHTGPYVCALIVVEYGGGSGGRRDVGGCVVYRYSHGRVFAAIFGPFPFGARGAFTVHTSYLSPSSATPNRPRARLCHPPRNGHARCRRLCKRSLSTLWVEVYGWAEGKRNCPINVFLANFWPRFR